jgi:hypothetical protein
MRIIRNERRLKTLGSVGRTVPWLAIATLFAGLVISFIRPQWVLAMLASVGLGLILSLVGGYFSERYAGPLAHHEALAKALKGLDDRHLLAQYILPAAHVLVDPGGCTVFVVKSQPGSIGYADGRWNHRYKGKFFRQLAGQENLGAPDAEAGRQMARLCAWLERRLPGTQVPVQGAIVFVHPQVSLEAEASPVPALTSKKLKAWLRGPGSRKPLPPEDYRRLVAAVEGER